MYCFGRSSKNAYNRLRQSESEPALPSSSSPAGSSDWADRKEILAKPRNVLQAVCERRFFARGLSLLHIILLIKLMILAVTIAFLGGLYHHSKPSTHSFVPHSESTLPPDIAAALTDPLSPFYRIPFGSPTVENGPATLRQLTLCGVNG
jgi:hypothetical protein